jgi:hypothetical protein
VVCSLRRLAAKQCWVWKVALGVSRCRVWLKSEWLVVGVGVVCCWGIGAQAQRCQNIGGRLSMSGHAGCLQRGRWRGSHWTDLLPCERWRIRIRLRRARHLQIFLARLHLGPLQRTPRQGAQREGPENGPNSSTLPLACSTFQVVRQFIHPDKDMRFLPQVSPQRRRPTARQWGIGIFASHVSFTAVLLDLFFRSSFSFTANYL